MLTAKLPTAMNLYTITPVGIHGNFHHWTVALVQAVIIETIQLLFN